MITLNMTVDVVHHEWWSGAEDTVRRCVDAGKAPELEALIKEHFGDTEPDEQDVNDFLRFEDDFIFSRLGIADEDEDGDTDTDEEGD